MAEKSVTAFQGRKIPKHTTQKAQPSGPVSGGSKGYKLCCSHGGNTSSEPQGERI